jgi:hypothetical protein
MRVEVKPIKDPILEEALDIDHLWKGDFFLLPTYVVLYTHLQNLSIGTSDHQLVELLTPSHFEKADKVINFGRKWKFGLNIHVKLNGL